ncbi:MAG: 4-diphosphocytidyl-2-C-methyl-D-erythritol kinase [Francisellaceae bacterium]|jgi:4-diphosphocytidyl-2-C-methyl-D-erythritol kinase
MATKNLTLNSYAKINLFLHITGKREDGYHNLQTIFQFIDLKDTLTFYINNTDTMSINSNLKICADIEDNLIYKAAQLIKPHANKISGYDISIKKNIPMGAGLGGGSSNAATTLLALNQLWQCNLNKQELIHIANKLGADVPIFLHGQTCWAEGTGNIFSKINITEQYILLIKPQIHISTKTLFNHLDLKKTYKPITPNEYNYITTNNAFEDIVRKENTELSNQLDKLSPHNKFRMTGTGSCFFILSDNKTELDKIQRNINKLLDTSVTKTLQFLPIREHILRGNVP